MAQHWTETVTEPTQLAQAFLFDFNPAKGDLVARERAEKFAARCVDGVGAFWTALENYMGKSEVKRIRGLV